MKELNVGDTYTIGGTTYEIGATSVADGLKALKITTGDSAVGTAGQAGYQAKLNAGDVITIDGKSYEIATKTDMEQAQITAAKITQLAAKGSTIEFNGKSVSVFSETGKAQTADYTDPNNKTLITTGAAYAKVKTELTAASSIGAIDERASVAAGAKKEVGSGTDKQTFYDFKITRGSVNTKNDLNFNLHVGSDADMTNKIGVTITDMSSASLGIQGLNVADATGKAATYAIDAIADAVSKVSAKRSSLGAIQNRLEHTISNVDNVVENTNAAESRIRDTDMADEMVNYSKNNILAQAGQSMLAQANQSTQGVLSILG